MDCGFVYYLNIGGCGGCVYSKPAGELLLCRRAKEPALGSLDLPGGFVDMGENIEEAPRREIYLNCRSKWIPAVLVFAAQYL